MNRGRRSSDQPWKQPFPLLIAVAGFLAGMSSLVTRSVPGTLDSLLPTQFDITWAVLLMFGAGVDLVGLFWRGRISTALLLRCSGLIGMGGALMVYGPVIAYVGWGKPGTLIPAIILTGYGIACWAQAWLLLVEERRIISVAQTIEATMSDHDSGET